MKISSLHKVKDTRVFEKAVGQLRRAILQGELPPGSKLPTENELAQTLGVGRSTIREAMRIIEAEGLIEVRRGAGAFVLEEEAWGATRKEIINWLAKREETVIQILQVRENIEGLTASLTARRITDQQKRELRQVVELMEGVAEHETPDIDRLSNYDVRFHLKIGNLSGNEIANEIVSHIMPAFSEANKAILYVGDSFTKTLREHRAILKALEKGDANQAEREIRKHISRVREDMCKYLEEDC